MSFQRPTLLDKTKCPRCKTGLIKLYPKQQSDVKIAYCKNCKELMLFDDDITVFRP